MLLFHTLKFSRPFSLSNVIVCADIVEKKIRVTTKKNYFFFSSKKNFVLKKNVGRGYKSSGVIFSSSPNLLNRTRMTFFFLSDRFDFTRPRSMSHATIDFHTMHQLSKTQKYYKNSNNFGKILSCASSKRLKLSELAIYFNGWAIHNLMKCDI